MTACMMWKGGTDIKSAPPPHMQSGIFSPIPHEVAPQQSSATLQTEMMKLRKVLQTDKLKT